MCVCVDFISAGYLEPTGVYVMASALDPRLKNSEIIEESTWKSVEELLVTQQGTAAEFVPKRRPMSSIEALISLAPPTPTSTALNELLFYRAMTATTMEVCPVSWWRSQVSHLPRLGHVSLCHDFFLTVQVANRILCIPATEVPSERIFSSTGATWTDRRANLAPETVAELVYLHKNHQLLQEWRK